MTSSSGALPPGPRLRHQCSGGRHFIYFPWSAAARSARGGAATAHGMFRAHAAVAVASAFVLAAALGTFSSWFRVIRDLTASRTRPRDHEYAALGCG